MAEEVPSPKRTRGKLGRLLLAALVLLVVAVVVNWRNINDIAKGRRTVHSVVYGIRQSHMGHHGTFKFPPPSGPETAKVKVLVLAQEGNPCHYPLIPLWQAIGALTADQVRVAYAGREHAAPKLGGKAVELGCESGVLINGKSKFVLKEGERQRTLYLTGPAPMSSPQPGSPPTGDPGAGPEGGHGWSLADLVRVLNSEIHAAYGSGGSLSVGAVKATQARLVREEEQRALASPSSVSSPPASH